MLSRMQGGPQAECLRFAAARQVPSQAGMPNFPPVGLQALQISEARLRSPLLGTYLQGKTKSSEPAHST